MPRSSSFLVFFQLFLLGLFMFTLTSTSIVPSSMERQTQQEHLGSSAMDHRPSLLNDFSSSSSDDVDDEIHFTEENDAAPWTSIHDQHRLIRAGYAAANAGDNRVWAIPYRFGKRSAMPYRFGKRGAAMHFRLGKKSIAV